MKKTRKGFLSLPLILVVAVLIASGGVYTYLHTDTASEVAIDDEKNHENEPVVATKETKVDKKPDLITSKADINWKTYTEDIAAWKLSFKYPEKLGQADIRARAFITTKEYFEQHGCYDGSGFINGFTISTTNINGQDYCISSTSDIGAGQLYREYYFSRPIKDSAYISDSYITLVYKVHTTNGCGMYDGEAFQSCQKFQNNYEEVVLKPIVQSVATLKFEPKLSAKDSVNIVEYVNYKYGMSLSYDTAQWLFSTGNDAATFSLRSLSATPHVPLSIDTYPNIQIEGKFVPTAGLMQTLSCTQKTTVADSGEVLCHHPGGLTYFIPTNSLGYTLKFSILLNNGVTEYNAAVAPILKSLKFFIPKP